MMVRHILAVLVVVVTPACAQTLDDGTLSQAAAALTKVAKAVDTLVAYDPAAAALPSDELLRVATRHDPDLLRPLQRFAVFARAEGRNSSVLVCTADQQRGLIEDAGCSGPPDLQLWRSEPRAPCAFSLNLVKICGP